MMISNRMTSRLGFLGDGMMKSNQIRKKKRTFFSFHFFKFETAQWSLRADIRRMALLSSRGLQSRATYRCTSSSVFQRVHFLFSFPILFHRLLRPILSFLFLMIRFLRVCVVICCWWIPRSSIWRRNATTTDRVVGLFFLSHWLDVWNFSSSASVSSCCL